MENNQGNPIKEAYELVKDTGIFLDEADFETQFQQNPKEVYAVFEENESTKGLFLDEDDFVTSLKKKEPTSQGSSTPSTPSAPSGFKDEKVSVQYANSNTGELYKTEIKTRENLIKELTVAATNATLGGDTKNLESIKRNIESQKQALEKYKKQNNIASEKAQIEQLNKAKLPNLPQSQEPTTPTDLRAVDTTMPTEQRGGVTDFDVLDKQSTALRGRILNFGVDKTNKEFDKALEDPNAMLSVDRKEVDNQLYSDNSNVSLQDYNTIDKATKSQDPNVAQQAQALKKDKDNQLLFEYFDWKLRTSPEEGKALLERKADIERRGDLNLQDEQWLADQQVNALRQKAVVELDNAKKLVSSMDNVTYNKEAVMVDEKIKSLLKEKEKYENADTYLTKYKEFENETKSVSNRMDEINNELQTYIDEQGVLKDNKYLQRAQELQKEGQALEGKYNSAKERYAYIFDQEGKLKLTPQQEKANEIVGQINSLVERLDEVAVKTGVTQDKQDKVNNAYDFLNSLGDREQEIYNEYPKLKEARDEASRLKTETEEFTKTANVGTQAVGGFIVNMGQAIESGLLNVKQAPKILADFLTEDVGVPSLGLEAISSTLFDNWFDEAADRMYVQQGEKLSYAEGLEKPTIVKGSEIMGSGLGSVLMFAGGGEIASVAKIPKLAGLWGTAFITQEGSNYREALDAGLTPSQARLTSMGISAVSATVELIVPDFKYLDDAARASVIRVVQDNLKKGLGDKEAVKAAIKEVFKEVPQSLKAYGLNMAQEGAEEGIENLSVETSKSLVNYVEGRELYQDTFNPTNLFESILGGVMVGGTMTSLNRPNKKSPLEQALIAEISNATPEQVAEISAISPENAGVIMEIQEVGSGLRQLPTFEALPPTEKNYVISEMYRKKLLEDAMRQAGIKDGKTLEEVEEITERVQAVLDGKKIGETVEVETKENEPNKTLVIGEEYGSPTIKFEDAPSQIDAGTTVEFDSVQPTNVVEETDVLNTENKVETDVTTTDTQAGIEVVESTETTPVEVENVQNVQSDVQDALKDVESTTKSLEGVATEKPITNLNFEINLSIEDGLSGKYKGEKNIVYHGSPDISYLSNVESLNPKDNTQNAESKYVYVNPNSKTARSYSSSYNGYRNKSGIAVFQIKGKKYVMKKSDILSIKNNEQNEAFLDRKKEEGYDYVEIPQDGGNIAVLNKSALELVGVENNSKTISEAYHKAKADGSNPELVQAVESLLGQPTNLQEGVEGQPTTLQEPLSENTQSIEQDVKLQEAVLPQSKVEAAKSKTQKAKDYLSKLKGTTPTTIEGNVRQFFAFGGKVSPESLRAELGLNETRTGELESKEDWRATFGFSKSGASSIQKLAENIATSMKEETGQEVDVQDVYNAIVDILRTENKAAMREGLDKELSTEVETEYTANMRKAEELFWENEFLREQERLENEKEELENQIANDELERVVEPFEWTPESMSTVDEIMNMTQAELMSEYIDVINENGELDEQLFNAKIDERLKGTSGSSVSTQVVKDAVKETIDRKRNEKAERAKQKVNAIAENLKEKLRAKGIENLNIKKQGINSDYLIDALANMVNALIEVGYNPSNAIQEVIDSAKGILGIDEAKEAEQRLKDKIIGGVDVDAIATEFGTSKDIAEDEVIRTLTINPNEASNNGEKVLDDLNNASIRIQKVKSLIRALNSAEGLEQGTKDKLNSELGEFYTVLSDEELQDIGNAIIEEYGGLDNVIKNLNNLEIPPFIKVFAIGQGIINAREGENAAKTEQEKEAFADKQIELSDMLDNLVRDYGRAISYLRVIYYQSPLSVVRKLKKEIAAQNEIYGKDSKEKAQSILDVLDSAETTIEVLDDLMDNADEVLKLTIEEQQKEIDKLKNELSKLTKGSKGKSNTKKRKFTKKGLQEKLKEARSLASSGINHKMIEALGYAAGLAIEEGYYKFKDFYAFIRENFSKEEVDTDDIANAYTNAIDKANEEGADKKNFETREQVDAYLNEVERLEAEIAEKEKQVSSKKKIQAFSRLLSEKVDEPKARKKKEDNLRERAAELDKEYNTTAFSEQAEAYIEGKRVEKLTTPSQVLKSIEKGLIEAGYVKEVNGKQKVDWDKIVKGEKNPQKAWEKVDKEIKKLLSPADYLAQAPLLRDIFFANVNDRKVKAVQAEINKISRKKLPLNRARRKSKAERLVEMYNTGALSNKQVRQAIADDLGIVEFTPEEDQYINDLIEGIDKAPIGAEKEILEEELYNFFDSKKKGYLLRGFFERQRARLLTGPITSVKNFMGIFTAANKLIYDYLVANIQSLGKGATDAQIFKVTKKAQVMATNLMMDVWWNGGVDMGSAFSETTGTKEGTARIRYMEYAKNTPLFEGMGFSKISIMQPLKFVDSAFNKVERKASRTLQAVDSYNAFNVQETSTYVFIKAQLKKAHPEWSNKTLLEKTWDVMYGKTLEEAKAQAEQEFEDRGISLQDTVGDNIRFNRRVYEIIQQARGEAAVKAGQLAANRYTFKAQDAGVGSAVYYMLMGIKKGMNASFNLAAQGVNKVNPKFADRIRRSGNVFSETIFTVALPFIKGVTNILEKRLELFPPYGVAKGVAYTVMAKLNQDNPSSEYNYQRAGEYYWRAATGALLIALLKYMADDDEEGFKKIYASGTPDWRDNNVESKVAMQNRIVINNRAIPFQAFGTGDLNLMVMGVINDMARENAKISAYDLEKKEAIWLEAGARMTESVLRDEYLKGFMNMYKGVTDAKDTYWNRTLAEYFTRSVIPATSLFRQTFDLATKEQLKPITFSEHLMKQSGLVGGWMLDRKAYDILGNTYDNGSLYGNSPGSFMNIFKTLPEVEYTFKFLEKYKPVITNKSSENQALDIMDGMGGIRKMDNVEYYDYGFEKNKYFGEVLRAYVSTDPESNEVDFSTSPKDGGNVPKVGTIAYDKLFKEASLQLSNEGEAIDLNSDSSVEMIEERIVEIANNQALSKDIAKTINELNTLSHNAAFEEFLIKRDLFVPYSVRGAKDKYLEKLSEFE